MNELLSLTLILGMKLLLPLGLSSVIGGILFSLLSQLIFHQILNAMVQLGRISFALITLWFLKSWMLESWMAWFR